LVKLVLECDKETHRAFETKKKVVKTRLIFICFMGAQGKRPTNDDYLFRFFNFLCAAM